LADAATLEELRLLTPIQIDNFITYRTLLGKFLTIYEIQAIPGWDLATIQKIRPYIMVSQAVNLFNAIGSRLKKRR
jgi:DNA uptake protein ComE-like DNA-binding protein